MYGDGEEAELIRAGLLLTLLFPNVGSAAAAELMCAALFPQKNISIQVSFGEKPSELESSMQDDYRLYLLHPDAENHRVNLPVEQNSLANKIGKYSLEYIYSIQGHNFCTLTAEDGIQFSILQNLLVSLVSGAETMKTLDRIADVVRNESGASEFDFFFSSAKQTGPNFRLSRANLTGQENQTERYRIVRRVPVSAASGRLETFRYFTTWEHTTDNLVVQIHDTEMGTDAPSEFPMFLRRSGLDWRAVWEKHYQSLGLPSGHGFRHQFDSMMGALEASWKSETELLNVGRQEQVKMLDEVFEFIAPLYEIRRKWSKEFIQGLYKKALASLDVTRYIIVRRKTADGSIGPIVAVLGLNRAPYGKLIQFNEATNEWGNHYLPGMSAFANSFGYTLPAFHDQPFFDEFGSAREIPRLGMEDYFGKNFWLPRPSILEVAVRPSGAQLPGLGENRTTSHGLYFQTGQIYEPVKFGIAKDKDLRGLAYSEIILELFRSVFSDQRDPEFNSKAQFLYTYNDHSGALYKAVGFKDLNSGPTQSQDGLDWTLLGLSPESLLLKSQDPGLLEERVSENFLRQLQEDIALVVERQSGHP